MYKTEWDELDNLFGIEPDFKEKRLQELSFVYNNLSTIELKIQVQVLIDFLDSDKDISFKDHEQAIFQLEANGIHLNETGWEKLLKEQKLAEIKQSGQSNIVGIKGKGL